MPTHSAHLIIAIDGPTASGKGTLARALAAQLNLAYLDTGALYRAVAFALTQGGADHLAEAALKVKAVEAATTLDLAALGNPNLRLEIIGQLASRISAFPEVRAALLALQRDFAQAPDRFLKAADGTPWAGVVLDGRDIGTVILPDAPYKFFLTASTEIRAKRRFLELSARDQNISYAQVLKDLEERDNRDKTRAISPLAPAKDAVIIDTSLMTPQHVLEQMVGCIHAPA